MSTKIINSSSGLPSCLVLLWKKIQILKLPITYTFYYIYVIRDNRLHGIAYYQSFFFFYI